MICKKGYEVQVLHSMSGHYIGTWDDGPNCRISEEYYKTFALAEKALDENTFTLRYAENNICNFGNCWTDRSIPSGLTYKK